MTTENHCGHTETESASRPSLSQEFFMKNIGLLAIFFSLFVFAVGVDAQVLKTSSALNVTVKDTNGAIVPGAALTVTGRSGAVRNAVIDSTGTAKFDNLSAGEYRVRVDAAGFPAALRDVSVNAGVPNDVEITLQLGTISETVNVTATRTQVTSEETAIPVSVVAREELERKGVNTVGDIFRTLPGSATVNEGAFQVRPRIRGLDSNRVLILVDGERLNNSRTSTAQSGVETGLVDISQIETVEVARGSGSVLYGTDALAGTINIITRDTPPRRESGIRFGGELGAFYTSNEKGRRANAALNGSGKYFAFRVAQSMERFGNYFTGKPNSQFLSELRDPSVGFSISDEGEVLNSQSHGSDSQATLRFFPDDKKTLRFNYDRRRGANIGSAGLVENFNAFFPFSNRDKFNARYDIVGLTRNLQRLSLSGYYQTQYRNFSNIVFVGPIPNVFPGLYQTSETVTNTRTQGSDLQTDWTFGSRNNLTAGASFFRDENADRRLVVTAVPPSSTHPSRSTTKSVPDASLENLAAFAQDEFRVTDRFTLVGGVRIDNFKTASNPTTGFALPPLTPAQVADLHIGFLASGLSTSHTSVTGDMGGIYRLRHDISLSARIGRSFRTPNLSEFFFMDRGSVSGSFQVGNADLRPETGINFDTSVKVRRSRFVGSATYFRNSYKDFLTTVAAVDREGHAIFLIPQPGQPPIRVYQTVNFDRATIQGFETEFEAPMKIRLGYLTPNGNSSWLHGEDTQHHVPLDAISPFRTNLGVRWTNYGKSYFFDYYARIVATQHRISPFGSINQGTSTGPEPGFTTHNISGGYYFRREKYNFNVNLGVSNLTDRTYSEQFVFAPARGRSFTVGTSWQIK
jgi:outer membrane receptor protein involved in Fe transport